MDDDEILKIRINKKAKTREIERKERGGVLE